MKRAFLLCPGILFLAACTQTATPAPGREVFRAPPAALLTCAPDPDKPAAETQADVARYVVRLHAAGQDCRGKLGAVRDWNAKQWAFAKKDSIGIN